MTEYYCIAQLVVAMDTFGRTHRQAEPYRCEEGQANITIDSHWQELQALQPHLSDEDCEYLASGADFYRQLLRYDGMMLHASAVAVNGKAYLFFGPSGVGKSTHTQLWRYCIPGSFILNDDKPALRQHDGAWYAYGTPWSGKQDMSVNVGMPVAGICLLQQAENNWIAPLDGKEAIFAILEQTLRPGQPALGEKLLELTDQLIRSVPLWKMGCTPSGEAVLLAYEAMRQGDNCEN